MIIWLNGAHGAGKTSVAGRILRRHPGAWLFDPERIGFMLRRAWPGDQPDDFKDMPAWRDLTLAALKAVAAEAGAVPVLVPMTLADPQLFREIVGGLRASGLDVRHFTLTASAETLRKRLRRRLDWPASRRWAMKRAEADAAALAHPSYARHLDTERASIADLAAAVMRLAGG